ncbi:MAG: XrtA system polysaccharide deacetylase [Pseudomonadales bacterium]|jgi:polysaccharide deacetylase family protein (PEP-CTERM system associated)|nr:XrtA system polysaccharide deacetylase [Pseudomonadales bacterium]
MSHALTVDVEDYFQVAAFFDVIPAASWDHWPSRVRDTTHRVLDLIDEADRRATFFVLGWVAERHPELVREIHRRGHEVACHGYSHQYVYGQAPTVFREETCRSKHLLEQLTGEPVTGYRAASYSITPESSWALEILVEAGFRYDSSIFPIRHDHYGFPGAPLVPHWAETASGSLLEFPLTTAEFGPLSLPVAGGGYFRLYPYSFTRSMIRRHQRTRSDPFIFYLHPWEIDPDQPRIPNARLRSRLRHYLNLKHCEARLTRLLNDFEFQTMGELSRTYAARPELERYRYGD